MSAPCVLLSPPHSRITTTESRTLEDADDDRSAMTVGRAFFRSMSARIEVRGTRAQAPVLQRAR
jgi:hypothetical protein